MTWPPDPNAVRVRPRGIAIALAIGLGLAIISYTAGALIFNSFPKYTYPPYIGPSDSPTAGDGDYSPIASGAPGLPTAVLPVLCPVSCFTEDSVAQVILDDTAFTDITLDAPDIRWKVEASSTADVEHNFNNAPDWRDNNVGHDECFPLWPPNPDDDSIGVTSTSTDVVGRLLSTTGSDGLTLDQWVRIYPDTGSAQAHMQTMRTTVDTCPQLVGGTNIIPEAALENLPDSVAGVGAIRSNYGDRVYVTDLQRGNLVIRTYVHSTGGITDTDYRALLSQQAELLSEAAF